MAKILVLNGPNLNLLGTREPSIYGRQSLDNINLVLSQIAEDAGHSLDSFQSNAEAELITRVHQAQEQEVAFIIINPAAFTHTSIALRDALLAINIPYIEVHLSNVHAREEFRHQSYFIDKALGAIIGLGADGYQFALQTAIRELKTNNQ